MKGAITQYTELESITIGYTLPHKVKPKLIRYSVSQMGYSVRLMVSEKTS